MTRFINSSEHDYVRSRFLYHFSSILAFEKAYAASNIWIKYVQTVPGKEQGDKLP